ncbi:MAG: type II toxin-antitoxin system mRNA interferase toxin, RelE/StbE family [Schlesneria sp.]
MRRLLLRSPAFGRDLRKWLKSRPETAASIEFTLEQLSADATQPALRTHKLHGSLAGCWACSADYDLRIVFEYTQYDGAEAILLLALGTHDQVY